MLNRVGQKENTCSRQIAEGSRTQLYGKRWKRDGAKPLCSENIDGLQPHT